MILGQYVIFGYYMRINKDFRATEFTFERNLSAGRKHPKAENRQNVGQRVGQRVGQDVG